MKDSKHPMNLTVFVDFLEKHWIPTSIFGMVAAWSPSALEFLHDAGEVFKVINIVVGFAIGVTVLALNIKKLRKD
jgi:hypothetical protein